MMPREPLVGLKTTTIDRAEHVAALTGLLPEPRCRICRDPAVRREVDALLAWRGVPVHNGGKFRPITLAGIHRRIEHLNAARRDGDRITYTALWNHHRRHYSADGLMARVAARIEKDLQRLSAPRR